MRTLAALAVLLTACATTTPTATTATTTTTLTGPAAADPAVVRTDAGAVRGSVAGGHRLFQGIRYATAGRWEPPAPPPAWRGVLDATRPGAMCPQVGSPYAPVRSENEDCLFLNVTTPAKPGTRRPVMVWLHGDGALGAGHYSDARRLAARGVVVVTINYRLGVFGGFGHPGLRDGGTYGLQDQTEALRWVRRNAAAFGGDPGNVTVFGVSYGASAIGALLTSPAAGGLFHRAIMQSGETLMDMPAGSMVPGLEALPSFMWRSRAEVSALGRAYAGQLGCADLACLRALPVEKILEVPQIMNAFQTYAYGNRVLPESPAEALRKGRFHRVPVLAGATRDEHRLFVAMNYDIQGKTPNYPKLVREAFGRKAPDILRKYPINRYKSPSIAWATVLTDRMWARATHEQNTLLAQHVPVYGYEFADRDAPMFLPLETGFDWGAYHAGDLPYLFEEKDTPLAPAQRALSDRMIGYWANFARAGDPNGKGLPGWPRAGSGTLALEPGKIRVIDYAARHRLGFWK
ncbi:carboxylesterase/lipase family protein [Nonomuraea sp. SBT364]|uniref:carboxylesterase/lipase family protein n=1 Tax=Nonomuraea sp. SBT364 TaxID=1580530 RepID=UPI0009EA8A8F|nr:carboxylesterase family protein [Nonomuraea sp. SBT364]